MGIQGLIPFLEKTSRPINISEFSGCTVAIDAYCWLHKGAFSCAEKLARGEKCDAYVYYCMKYINMLLSHNIKPIMVFDGQHLPAKAATEKKRRENRELNRRRAAELLRQDKPNEARSFIRRCVDITHTMAVELMHACRAANVDCVTAPYEADAQLAYLNLTGIAHLVITEDSDLILFGCKKVVFKLDPNGGGLLVEQDKLHLSIKSRPENYNFEKFRRMCILSGCDYLPSLPGIGLSKASRFITRTMDPDIERALPRMSSYLNMPQLIVTKEYIKNFIHAEAMFKHQPVFDPIQRKVVPLTPLDENTPKLHLPEPIAEDQAYQLALGNLDPFTLKVVANWNPDDRQNTRKNWGNTKQAPHLSIWDSKFQITEPKFRPVKARQTPCSTAGKQTTQNPNIELETSNLIDDKDFENILFDFDEDKEISKQPFKKVCLSAEEESVDKNAMEVEEEDEHRKSPILSRKGNSKSKLFSKLKKQRSTVVDEKVTVQSRYFNSSPSTPKSAQKPKVSCTSGDIEKDRLRDISNVDEVMRRSSPKKLTTSEVDAEKMTTIKNSPKRKNRKISFSPGKRSIKSITIRSSLFTELSMEENNDKVTDNSKNKKEDKDNDSGVSCPSSFELDNVEECSQSSAKSAASSSTFAWKQKFHEKFGFKGSGGAERVLSCSKAVSSGFQRPSCSQGEAEIGKIRTPSRSDEGFSGQNEAEIVKSQTPLRADDEDYSITSSCKANAEIRTPLRVETDAANVIKPQTPLSESDDNAQQKTPAAVTRRSNPFKMNSSQKCSMNSTPKFNLLRDAITDCEMDQEMKDQISILSTPAKQKMSLCGQETPNQKNPFGSNKSDKSPSKSIQSNKSLLESIKTEKSPFGSIKQEKSSFGSSKPDKSPFGSSKTGSSIKPSNSSVKGKCRSVGLGKKSTPNSSGNSSQRSLLSMFALQPKPKLECK